MYTKGRKCGRGEDRKVKIKAEIDREINEI
jgi:hypothetical protein